MEIVNNVVKIVKFVKTIMIKYFRKNIQDVINVLMIHCTLFHLML